MARNYPKVARPYCAPPADYAGKLYYRVQPNRTAIYPTWLKVVEADRDRFEILYNDRNQDRGVLSSGLDLDETGKLLPQWRIPIKYDSLPEKQPYEFNGALMSERVHDVIEQLEPGRHIMIPCDHIAPDGTISRWYHRKSGDSFLYATAPPALHPALNRVEAYKYDNGEIGFHKPAWAWVGEPGGDDDFAHFGYLNESVVGGRHLFNLELLDNQMVLSADLFDRLRALGDNVLDRRDYWIPIGSAPHAEPEGGYQVPEPPLSQKAEPPFPTRFLKSMARLFERR